MPQLILITGTPGTGKSAITKRLCKDLLFFHIEIDKLIQKGHWYDGYDRSLQTRIVDEPRVRKELSLFLRGAPQKAIIDTHLTAVLGPRAPSLVIVATCALKTLNRRLKARNYNKKKIKDNLEAETFEVCRTDASLRYGQEKILIYDSSRPIKETYPGLLREVRKFRKLSSRTSS